MEEKIAIWTIGHSGLSLEKFCGILDDHRIGQVADVRSTPYSRHVPHFNREALSESLGKRYIRYSHLGEGLGGRPQGDHLYGPDGVVRYDLAAREPAFREQLGELILMGRRKSTAIMCAEGDPLRCHRALMVAVELERAGTAVTHILPDGGAASQDELMEKLVEGLMETLIGSREPAIYEKEYGEMLQEAVRRQASRVAHRRRR